MPTCPSRSDASRLEMCDVVIRSDKKGLGAKLVG
jgi:hypothetical protein